MIRGVAALSLLWVTSAARADVSSSASADDYHRAGEAAYRAGDFQGAAAAFHEAYRLDPRAETVFNLAQSYRQIYVADHGPGALLQAVELYREYLAAVPRGGRSRHARELLSNLDPLVQLLRASHPQLKASAVERTTQIMVWSTATGASARIDDAPAAPLPLAARVTPGRHWIQVSGRGYADAELDVTAVADRLVAVEARLVPLPARLTIRTRPDATIVVDDVPRTITGSVLELPHGTHRVWAGARGHLGVERFVTLAPGQGGALDLHLPTSPRRRAAWWVLGASAALAAGSGGALGYAWLRSEAANDLYDARDTRPWTAPELDAYEHDRAAARTWGAVSLGLVVTAAVTAAIGAWLYVADVPHPPSRSR